MKAMFPIRKRPNKTVIVAVILILGAIGLLVCSPLSQAQQEPNRQLVQSNAQRADTVHRIALVIGNGAYTNAPPLKNPPNDARDMAANLKTLGFDVSSGVNVSQREMKRLIREFGQKLKAGGNGLFYYAGHGVQARGHNYIIPVDADIQSEADVEDSGVDVGLVLNYMDDAQNGLNIVILDACRNNPFSRSFRSASEGLAQVDAPTGTLIAYATAPGRVAADGVGANGLYTSELLKAMRLPGLTATDMFMQVRAEVMKRTGNKQVPWEASSLVGSFYFNGQLKNTVATQTGPAANETKADPSTFELSYWESIKSSTDPEDFKAYLKKYQNGQFADLARNNLRRLETAGKTENKSAANPDTSPGNTRTAMPPNPPLPLHSFDFVTVKLDISRNLKSRETKSANAYLEDLGGVKLEMVAIPSGEFMMGSPGSQGGTDEHPQHQVRIDYWFYLGKFEVTQAQWRAVMGTNPSHFKDCDECPVEEVSWSDAAEFCRKLSAATGREYRLPSEAEWEYAARAGTTTTWAFGDNISPEIANYNPGGKTGRMKTLRVGSLGVANAFGLYDMYGNVWEWCQDWYHDSYAGIAGDAPTDGSAWLSGGEQEYRVLRGGSWDVFSYEASSDHRGKDRDTRSGRVFTNDGNNGFRVMAMARTR
jgi:formylglycine-generating enzyme required for sulfatase activity/uncharacterized caspase-like protein